VLKLLREWSDVSREVHRREELSVRALAERFGTHRRTGRLVLNSVVSRPEGEGSSRSPDVTASLTQPFRKQLDSGLARGQGPQPVSKTDGRLPAVLKPLPGSSSTERVTRIELAFSAWEKRAVTRTTANQGDLLGQVIALSAC
jgi:hypothetical protein